MPRKKCGTCKTILKALEAEPQMEEPDWNTVLPAIAILAIIPTAIIVVYTVSHFTQQP